MKEIEISEEQRKAEGARLELYIKQKGLSQEELSLDIGVGQPMISKWCKGTKPIPAKRLYELSAQLDFNPLEFRPNLVELMGAPASLDAKTKEQLARVVAKVIRAASVADHRELQRLEQIVHLVLGERVVRPNKPQEDQED